MAKYEFEFFECTGRTLFCPINDEAHKMCTVMRRKNLTEKDIEFYINQGEDISLRPRARVKESLHKYVVNHEVTNG